MSAAEGLRCVIVIRGQRAHDTTCRGSGLNNQWSKTLLWIFFNHQLDIVILLLLLKFTMTMYKLVTLVLVIRDGIGSGHFFPF